MILDTFRQDVRVGARVLFKEKGFCLLAVGVLALGISGVTAQFSVIDGMLLRALPFRDSEQLVDVQWRDPGQPPGNTANLLTADYVELKEVQQSFSGFAGYLNGSTVNVTIRGNPVRLQGSYVTEDFLTVLGAQPLPGGRDFTAADNVTGAPRVTLISHALWQEHFGGDPDVIGQTMRMNGKVAEIIGVMPEGFAFPTGERLWVPYFNEFPLTPRNDPRQFGLNILARLKPEVSIDQAMVEWMTLAKRTAAANPDTNKDLTEAVLQPLVTNFIGRQLRGMLYIMLGAVVVVLLIACVNVMNMQFARATLRGKELAIRGALGASRIRLVRQMLTESLLLAVLGASAGAFLAHGWIRLLNRALTTLPFPLPYWIQIRLDERALVMTIAIAVVAALLSGLLPAWMASRANAADALKESGRGNTSRSVNVLTRLLVIKQIGLTCALLVLSLLIVRSVINRQHIDYGYDTDAVLSARLGLFDADYPTPEDRRLFFTRVLRELRADPAIAHAALTSRFRMTFGGNGPYEVGGDTYASDNDRPQGSFERISDDYFATLGLKILEGRGFTADDADEKQPVAIVNAAFARKHFGPQSALGRQIRGHTAGTPEPWRTIVGVVPDTRMQGPINQQQLGDEGFFTPLNSQPTLFSTILVRPRGGRPETLTAAVQRAVNAVDPNLPLYFVSTPKQFQYETLAQNRIAAAMFSAFGIVAVVLAAAGLYGVMAFSVNQRTQEFGVRMALGADRRNIVTMVLAQGGIQLGIGLGLGVVGGGLLLHFANDILGGFLFGVGPYHVPTYLFVIILLTAIALISCLVPAWRATKVDPMIALRAE